MGVSVAPVIFQEKINDIFHSFEHIQAYMDDVLLTNINDWDDYLFELKRVLFYLAEAELKVNVEKRFFLLLIMQITWILGHTRWDMTTGKKVGSHCQNPTSKNGTTSLNMFITC